MPGAKPEEVGQAARSLKAKLQPEKLNNSPLKDIAPIRIAEFDESPAHLNSYWQRCGAARQAFRSAQAQFFGPFQFSLATLAASPFPGADGQPCPGFRLPGERHSTLCRR